MAFISRADEWPCVAEGVLMHKVAWLSRGCCAVRAACQPSTARVDWRCGVRPGRQGIKVACLVQMCVGLAANDQKILNSARERW